MSVRRKSSKEHSEDPEILNFKPHITYVSFSGSLELSRCTDKCCGCTKVHCPFCNVSSYKPQRPARVRDHINQTHFKHALVHREKSLLMVKCYRQCGSNSAHFHCPYCSKQLLKKAGFLYHLRIHLRNAGKSELLVQVPNFKQPEHILFDGHVIQLCSEKCSGSLGKHYHCPLCGNKSFEEMGPLSDHLWRCRELMAVDEQSKLQGRKKKNTDAIWAENIVANASVPRATERYGDQCHISVVRNVGDLPLVRCEVVGCCRHRFHCCLCPTSKFKPTYNSHIQEHYLTHWNNRAVCGVYSCLVCYQDCLPKYGMSVYHFHCPKCGIVRRRKQQFVTHLMDCARTEMEKDKELYGYELTQDDMSQADDLDIHFEVQVNPDSETRADNYNVVKLETVEQDEEDGQDVLIESSVTSSSDKDSKRIWDVFDTVSAHISSEFVSAVEGLCPLEDILQEIGQRSGVEVTTNHSTNNTPSYNIIGSWDSVCVAKQVLREKIPGNICSSMQDSDTGNKDTASLRVCASSENTPSKTTRTSKGSRDSSNPVKNSENRTNTVQHEMSDSRSVDGLGRMSTRSRPHVQSPPVQHRSRKMPTALEVLSSAVEIIKNEEQEVESGSSRSVSQSDQPTVDTSSPGRRGRKKRKVCPPAQLTSRSRREGDGIKSESAIKDSSDVLNDQSCESEKKKSTSKKAKTDIMPPTNKRYSTRGNKVDFSFLATGKRKKEFKPLMTSNSKGSQLHVIDTSKSVHPQSVPSTESSQTVEDEPDYCESSSQTVEDDPDYCELDDADDSYQSSEDLVDRYHDDLENESAAGNPCKKMVFGSMAVIPIVTFNMQSKHMSKQLSKHIEKEEPPVKAMKYSCVICEFETNSFFQLTQHYTTKHEISEDLHCDQCLVICLNDSMKQDHQARHHDKQTVDQSEGSHKCQHCDFVSLDFSQVTDHILQVHKTDCIRCDICEREFNKYKALSIHLTLKHGPRVQMIPWTEKRLTKCSMCSFDGEDFSALSDHLKDVHQVTEITRCDVCERVFDHEDEVEAHLKKQHGPFEEHLMSNRCSKCGMLCKNRRALNQHQIFIHQKVRKDKDDISLECKTCYFVASSPAEIRQHHLEHRKGAMTCPHCDVTCNNRSNLQFHIQLYHRKSEETHCEKCGKFFKHKRYKASHMKRHVGDKKYSCSVCAKGFFERSTMRAHMQIHKDVTERTYRYICSYCGSRYNSKSNFNDHMNKHTGQKPYQCDMCDKRFGFRSQMAQHKIFVHSKERPYKCTQCDRSFKLSVKLQQHMVSHTGISKYTCEICSRAFCSLSSLKMHHMKCKAGLIKKPQIILEGEAITQDLVLAAGSILEMPVDSYVIVNDQDGAHDLHQLTEGQEVTVHQPEVYACSVCKQEFDQYEQAVEHINTTHEEKWTDGQTDNMAATETGQTNNVTTTDIETVMAEEQSQME